MNLPAIILLLSDISILMKNSYLEEHGWIVCACRPCKFTLLETIGLQEFDNKKKYRHVLTEIRGKGKVVP
jgi:hypothetical protein